jgi:hypothetical protein
MLQDFSNNFRAAHNSSPRERFNEEILKLIQIAAKLIPPAFLWVIFVLILPAVV